MTDVFISYAREDQALARGLAEDLEARGYTTWWDTELRSGEDFYEVILSALTAAKVAIVIWSANSVKSAFVRDEARYALHRDKLITTKTLELDMEDVPFGFQSQHTDMVTDRDRIIASLDKLGVQPVPVQISEAASWEELKTTNKIDELTEYIGMQADPDKRKLAAERIAHLSAATVDPSGAQTVPAATLAEVQSLTTSKLTAFLQGLTFRVPQFQLTEQGRYSSIGITLAIIALSFILLGVGSIFTMSIQTIEGRQWHAYILFALFTFGPLYIVWRYSRMFYASKNKIAGTIISFIFILLSIGAGAGVSMVLRALYNLKEDEIIGSVTTVGFLVTSGYLTYRNIRDAR